MSVIYRMPVGIIRAGERAFSPLSRSLLLASPLFGSLYGLCVCVCERSVARVPPRIRPRPNAVPPLVAAPETAVLNQRGTREEKLVLCAPRARGETSTPRAQHNSSFNARVESPNFTYSVCVCLKFDFSSIVRTYI